jgi:hypothetical protein
MCDGVDLIQLAQGKIQCRAFMKSLMNLEIPQQQRTFSPAAQLSTFQDPVKVN